MSHDAFGNPAGQQPVPPPQQGATNGKAITALLLGLGGIFILPVVLSVPAIVVGRRARREIDAGMGTGRGLATAGIVLGWVATVLTVLAIVLVVVLGVALFEGVTAP